MEKGMCTLPGSGESIRHVGPGSGFHITGTNVTSHAADLLHLLQIVLAIERMLSLKLDQLS